MGDAGEGLVDAESRVQERLEELAREREERPRARDVRDPETIRAIESLRLARLELERQLSATTHERRKSMLRDAITEVEKRIAAAEAAKRPL
jgi:hypothetical protein